MARFWRCYNPKCQPADAKVPGFDFISEHKMGQCPKCGIEKGTRFGGFIVPLVVVHFDAPSGVVEGRGVGYAACDVTRDTRKGYRMTGEPAAVNCPLCKDTAAFKGQETEVALHPDYDLPISEIKGGKYVTEPVGEPVG